jgi:hypothetical protein
MNSKYLLKYDIFYELRIRGISSDGDTIALRKLFRSVIYTALTLQWDYLASVSVDDLCSILNTEIY